MSARPGNWQLLNHSADPVGGDPIRLDELTSYYRTMAETISSEAATLTKIGDGDGAELRGLAADAVRSRSRDVATSLDQASGRYAAIRDALTVYGPELERARSESAQALADAEAAEGSRVSSQGLADPSVDRPADAPPLTDQETLDIDRRTVAIGDASDAAASARTRLGNALAALNDAGQVAANIIRASWHDGLTDTTAYKIKEFFKKFLKILVKVLMWIGVALAVLAFFIPGLAALALGGAIIAVISLAASTALAAMGEGSWLDVILGAVSVLLIGAGALIAKIVQNSHIALLGKVATRSAKQANNAAALGKKVKLQHTALFDKALKGDIPVRQALNNIAKLDRKVVNVNAKTAANAKIADNFRVKPQWWNTRHPTYGPDDIGKIKDVLKGDYKWDRLLSVDRALKYRELRGVASSRFGIQSTPPPAWHFANGGRVAFGWGLTTFKIGVTPTGLGGDNSRWGAYDAGKATLTTAKI